MYESADAICPFYRKHTKTEIRCEGGRRIYLPCLKEINEHIKDVCGTEKWKRCKNAIEIEKNIE